MNVLILTRAGDAYATGPVIEALRARGGRPWVLETERFPTQVGLTWRGPGEGTLTLPGQGAVELSEMEAVWARRSALPALPPELPPDVRQGAAKEAYHQLMGALLDSPAFFMDPPAVYQRARTKALQLRLARQVGLAVPRTLESNDPEAVRAFAATCPGGLIAKMYNDLRVDGGTIFTNRIGPEELEHIDDVVGCPMIFQEAVPKALELRVIVVGLQVFAMALDSQALAGAELDWRRTGAQDIERWRPYALPEDARAAMLRLHDALGSNYGAADMILTPAGEHVLLESNGVGECFWFYPHLPVAEAIADLLLGRVERRAPPRSLR